MLNKIFTLYTKYNLCVMHIFSFGNQRFNEKTWLVTNKVVFYYM